MDNKSRITETLSISTHAVYMTILQAWAGRAELQYSGKFRNRNGQHFSGIFKVSSIARRYGIMFFIDLDFDFAFNISSHGLSTCFSRRFPYIDGPPFSPYKPLQNVNFFKGLVMCRVFRNCTHILTRIHGEKFEDMQNSKQRNFLKF